MGNKDQEKKLSAKRPSYLRGTLGGTKKAGPEWAATEDERAKASGKQKEEIPEEKAQQKETEDKPIYTWTIWLLPRRPLVSMLVVASLILCVAFAYWAFPQPFFLAIIGLILINRLAPFLFPVKCFVNELTVGYKTFLARDIRPWTNLVTYHQFPDGVLLTHDTRTIRGRVREGLFLYYYPDKSNKDEILKVVQSKLKPPKEAFEEKDKEAEKKGGIASAIRRIKRLKSDK